MKALHIDRADITAAKEGDSDAFGRIYDAYLDRLYRFVYYRVSDRATAEDLTEDIFVKAFETLPGYHDIGLPFEAWLFRVARNHVIDYYRTKKDHTGLEEALDVPSGTPTPLEEAERTLNGEILRQAMAKLRNSYREVLIMKYMEDRDTCDISHMLKKPEAHVRVLVSRAVAALRAILYETR
ncbi:sigma-70 family RNA polymerase sigma factor [Patescibacteria group bacterium]|nr:sigma-70 family RNA polymerase sigma factor [Patescibacteria group bacterium]